MEYLYVCHFSNGHIKVGRSIDPQSRMATHADRVSCVGIELIEHQIFECVSSSIPAEAMLIEWCRDNCRTNHKSEWFDGLGFVETCDCAASCAAQVYVQSHATDRKLTPKQEADGADALRSACKEVGGVTAMARRFSVTRAAVQQWRHNGVPAEYCPAIEAATGVRCEELRPDVAWGVLRGTDCDSAKPTKEAAQA